MQIEPAVVYPPFKSHTQLKGLVLLLYIKPSPEHLWHLLYKLGGPLKALGVQEAHILPEVKNAPVASVS